jgi:hypothetical protein
MVYGVSRSTLQRKFNAKNGRRPGRPTEEKLFVNGIITASKLGFPLTNFDIRMIAKAFIDRRGYCHSSNRLGITALKMSKSSQVR